MTQFIGLGTAAIGRPQYINIKDKPEQQFDLNKFREQGKAVLEAAYQTGIRYFDTAPGYGMAEKLVLDWVLEKQDESIEIATKWGYTYVANFNMDAAEHEIKEHSLSKLNEQWAVSEKLLPYLSTYQIHSATFDTGVLDNKSVLDRLIELKSNYNLLIGLTTTGSNQTEVINKALTIEVDGNPLFEAYQVTFNVFDQSLLAVNEKLRSQGCRVIVKEALANGRVFPNNNYPHYQATYHTLNDLAKKYNVGIDAVALRFCIDCLLPYKVLSGAAESSHLVENLKANNFTLSEKEIEMLNSSSVQPKSYWAERKKLAWN